MALLRTWSPDPEPLTLNYAQVLQELLPLTEGRLLTESRLEGLHGELWSIGFEGFLQHRVLGVQRFWRCTVWGLECEGRRGLELEGFDFLGVSCYELEDHIGFRG